MIKKNQFDQIFHEFVNGVITTFTVDLCAHLISINFYTERGDAFNKHSILFNDVASFYFVGQNSDLRFDMIYWQYAELSNIYFLPGEDVFIHKDLSKRPVPEFSTKSNFVLDIWSSYLFIEAKSIVVNGVIFDVGHPE